MSLIRIYDEKDFTIFIKELTVRSRFIDSTVGLNYVNGDPGNGSFETTGHRKARCLRAVKELQGTELRR